MTATKIEPVVEKFLKKKRLQGIVNRLRLISSGKFFSSKMESFEPTLQARATDAARILTVGVPRHIRLEREADCLQKHEIPIDNTTR